MLPLARASGAARATEQFPRENCLLRARSASRRSTGGFHAAAVDRRSANTALTRGPCRRVVDSFELILFLSE
jgi:hypothetical protein